MHLFLPSSLPANRPLPAAERLALEGYSVEYYPLGGELPAPKAGDRIVGVLNLMPLKEVTELDILRAIAPTEGRGNVVVMLLKFPGQTYKNTPHEHMDDFYVPVAEFLELTKGREMAARLIVTGAPLEKIAFEEVRYWTELCQLMDEARRRKLYTLYICWAAQAALYHRYGIEKRLLPEKQFGIYKQQVLRPEHPLMQGLGGAFPMPVSRHTDIAVPAPLPEALAVLAASPVTGEAVLADDGFAAYITGHLEYEPLTLHKEYVRDLSRGLPIRPAENYYPNDDPSQTPPYVWQRAARQFYDNFLWGEGAF